ncbi:acyl-CoA thioesterase domain-containing protein [Nocardioides caldifontis]|uniref:acyl-CoA thioesterase domain-containing protein n=1 Tax=Nocardioides caldifontis TaxID=2588938 RepID=UPI0011DF98D1|nr:acyl-CoA thioesterase domain-containing protein [Nocardioides caldifontis]
MDLAFFTVEGDGLVPTPIARSMWKDDQMHGVALSGALARTAERCAHDAGRDDLSPARWTVDLFRPASMVRCDLSAEVVRDGPRICLVDVLLEQDGRRVARASATFLKQTRSAPGEVWTPSERPSPPPEDVVPPSEEPRVPFFHSEENGWSQRFSDHQNASRKQTWQTGLPIVVGERPTAFQVVASVADATSMVTNWGANGVEYINTDITLALSRPAVGLEVGLVAADRIEHDGVAVGTATVLDRAGVLGSSMVTSLANAERVVNFENVEYTESGERRSV